jgi:hypothetical protein
MTDTKLKREVWRMQIKYWDMCMLQAARMHPNWKVIKGNELEWTGGRKGPRTPTGLLKWFLKNHPDEADMVRDRIAAAVVFLDNLEPETVH